MSSLSAKDRVSLCSFTFSDGRRCRTPRLRDNPRFCPYHAQKEARARAAQSLGKDLDYFFSGDYLSACDLTTALGRLIPAVIRGDVKPRTARTVAYLAQTLLQAIHLSKHEYINAFGTDGWRQSIHNSVKGNYDYRFPPAPKPEQSPSPQPPPQPAQTPVNCHSEGSDESAFSSSPAQPPTQPQSDIPTLSGPAPSPHTPLPPTSAEFVPHVMAGRNLSQSEIPPAPTCPDLIGSFSGTFTRPASAPQSEIPTLSGPAPSQTPSLIPTQAAPAPPATPSPTSSQAQQSEIAPAPSISGTLSGPASAPPSTPPKPAPVTQPLRSLALPLPVRRRLHRTPA